MSAGWIKVERELLSHPVLCRNPEFDERSAFLWLIAEAAFKPTKKLIAGELVTLEEGQLCHSFRFMKEAWGWDLARVQRFLNRLKSNTMIDTAICRGRLLVTVCNYRKYQRRFKVDRAAVDTPVDTAVIRQRYKLKAVKNQESNNVGVTTYVPEPPATGEREERRRESRGWSPKTNHPDQLDLINDTALAAEQREAAAIDPEPELELLQPGEPVAAPAAEPERVLQAPAPKASPPAELPLELSMEGEVMPAGDPTPPLLTVVSGEVIQFAKGRKTKLTGDAGFDEFYEAYPRHEDPAAAHAAYRAALKKPGVSHEFLMVKVAEYRAWLDRNPDQQDYIKYPATWLRKGSYASELRDRQGASHGQRGQHSGRRHGGISAERNSEIRQRGVADGLLRRLAARGAAAG